MFFLATTIILIISIFAGNYFLDSNFGNHVNESVEKTNNYWKIKRKEFDKGLLLSSIISYFVFVIIYGIITKLDSSDFVLNLLAHGIILLFIAMAIKILHIICLLIIKAIQKGKNINLRNKQVKFLFWGLVLSPLPILVVISHLL